MDLVTSLIVFSVPEPYQGLHSGRRKKEIKFIGQKYFLLSDKQSLGDDVAQLSEKLVLAHYDRNGAFELMNGLILAHRLVRLELSEELEVYLLIDAEKGIQRRVVANALDIDFGSLRELPFQRFSQVGVQRLLHAQAVVEVGDEEQNQKFEFFHFIFGLCTSMQVVQIAEEVGDLLEVGLGLTHLGRQGDLFPPYEGKGILLEEVGNLFLLLFNDLLVDQHQFPFGVELEGLVHRIDCFVIGVVVVLDDEVGSEVGGNGQLESVGLPVENRETSELIEGKHLGVGRAMDFGLNSNVLCDSVGSQGGNGVCV